jgi:hypothetical protein
MPEATRATCPHCGGELAPLEIPEAFFEHANDLACFNDDCPYFVRGFTWMEQQFGVRSSYRYRIDAQTGHASPLAAYAPRAPHLGSLPDDASGDAGEESHP